MKAEQDYINQKKKVGIISSEHTNYDRWLPFDLIEFKKSVCDFRSFDCTDILSIESSVEKIKFSEG